MPVGEAIPQHDRDLIQNKIVLSIFPHIDWIRSESAQRQDLRIAVYGAGSHTEELLQIWQTLSLPRWNRLLVTNTPTSTNWMGFPVNQISDVPAEEIDLIVLSSNAYESEMIAACTQRFSSVPRISIWTQNPSTENYLSLGVAHDRLDQLPLASYYFQRVIDLTPDCAEAHYRLGYVEARQNHLPQAMGSCLKATLLNPGWHNRHILLTLLLEHKEEVVSYVLGMVSDPRLREMIAALLRAPELYHPSKYWLFQLLRNVSQLETDGLDNFKYTVNTNYFNWELTGIDDQVDTLKKLVRNEGTFTSPDLDGSLVCSQARWSEAERERYKEFLILSWTFAVSRDRLGLLSRISEPPLGHPITIRAQGLDISQDLCNSVLEVNAMLEHVTVQPHKRFRVAELGAGYGRLPYVLRQALPGTHVTIIDIPPALHIAQWYYSRLFPNERIFRYREFRDYEEIRSEFENASVAFLLAPQVEMLPPKIFDLFINVSSLHEMTLAQVHMWFDHIDRLCSGHFYSKQYVTSTNDLDEVCIQQADYPVKSHWRELFARQCAVQTRFFESLFALSSDS